MGEVISLGAPRPVDPERALKRIQKLWEDGEFTIEPAAQEVLDARNMGTNDLQHLVKYGKVVNHRRTSPTAPMVYTLNGLAVEKGALTARVTIERGRLRFVTLQAEESNR